MPTDQKGPKETVPGAIIYNDMNALLEMSNVHSPGTLAFILDEQALLVRVRGGWQYVSVSYLFCLFFLFKNNFCFKLL